MKTFDTQSLIMLAALGAAAYFFARKASAATASPITAKPPVVWAQNPTAANADPTTGTLINAGVSLLSDWLTGRKIATETASETAAYGGVNWDGTASNSPFQYSNVAQENAQNYSRGDN